MEIGGIERSLINMLESFDYTKFNVDLMIFHHIGEFMNLIPKQVNVLPEVRRYTVFRKPIKQCFKEGHYTSVAARVIAKLYAYLLSKFKNLNEGSGYIEMQLSSKYLTFIMPRIKKTYDLAISYAWPHDFTAQKVNAYKKVSWIHTDYSQLEVDPKLDQKVWESFDFVASISEACTQTFLTKYPSLKDKIIRVENITSPDFIKKMADINQQIELKENYFNIVSVGRLSYAKGFDNAVIALKKLHQKGMTDIKWYVVGYGGFEHKLREIIFQMNMEEHFILLGKKMNPYTYIQGCDLYVQPSRYEGKAVTVTEAKILGKPILLTNYPTSRSQLVDGEEGLICDQSIDGLFHGIEQLYKNHEFRKKISFNNSTSNFDNSFELINLYKVL
jgi:glycosyltransferase involved in cell wall biosynthesis